MTLRRASHCQRADRGPKGKPPRAVGLEPAAGGDVYTVGDHTHLSRTVFRRRGFV